MKYGHAAEMAVYEEPCNVNSEHSICHELKEIVKKDPIIVAITLAAIIGSFCLLSGFVLLAMISRVFHDQTSEAILLMGMGFFVLSIACITWKLTYQSRLGEVIGVLKHEDV